FIVIVGGPRNEAGVSDLIEPLILDVDAGVVLAEIDRRMRLPISVRVADVRRRLRQRDALSRADVLAQEIRIARRDDRARNPRTRATIGTEARRARARPAPRAADDRDCAGDAAGVRKTALRKGECRQARLRKGRVDLNWQAVRRYDRRIGPALAARDQKAKPDRRKKWQKPLSRSSRRPPARPGGAPAPPQDRRPASRSHLPSP